MACFIGFVGLVLCERVDRCENISFDRLKFICCILLNTEYLVYYVEVGLVYISFSLQDDLSVSVLDLVEGLLTDSFLKMLLVIKAAVHELLKAVQFLLKIF